MYNMGSEKEDSLCLWWEPGPVRYYKTSNHHSCGGATLPHMAVEDHGWKGHRRVGVKQLWDVFNGTEELVEVLLLWCICCCDRDPRVSVNVFPGLDIIFFTGLWVFLSGLVFFVFRFSFCPRTSPRTSNNRPIARSGHTILSIQKVWCKQPSPADCPSDKSPRVCWP